MSPVQVEDQGREWTEQGDGMRECLFEREKQVVEEMEINGN